MMKEFFRKNSKVFFIVCLVGLILSLFYTLLKFSRYSTCGGFEAFGCAFWSFWILVLIVLITFVVDHLSNLWVNHKINPIFTRLIRRSLLCYLLISLFVDVFEVWWLNGMILILSIAYIMEPIIKRIKPGSNNKIRYQRRSMAFKWLIGLVIFAIFWICFVVFR